MPSGRHMESESNREHLIDCPWKNISNLATNIFLFPSQLPGIHLCFTIHIQDFLMKHVIQQVWDTLPRGVSFIRPLAFHSKIQTAHSMGLPCFPDSKSRTVHTQENAIQRISREKSTQVVSAAKQATGNMGSPVSSVQTANTLKRSYFHS